MNLIQSQETVKFYRKIGLSEKARILEDFITYVVVWR